MNNCSYPKGECVDGTCQCAQVPHPYDRFRNHSLYGGADCSSGLCCCVARTAAVLTLLRALAGIPFAGTTRAGVRVCWLLVAAVAWWMQAHVG